MEYNEIDAINWSTLKHIQRSPAHFKYLLDNPPKQTAAQSFGVAVHEAILEPDKFQENYIIAPDLDKRTKAYKEWAETVDPSKGILTKWELESIGRMRTAFEELDFEFSGAKVEQILQRTIDGVKCKGRADIITDDGIVIDLKTTQDASFESFKRDALYKYQYNAQLACYADMADCQRQIIIAIEKEPPYGAAVFELSKDAYLAGRIVYRECLEKFKECLEWQEWPSYEKKVFEL